MLGAVEVRLSITCEACGNAVPVNGPTPIVKCGRCMEVTRLEGERVGWPALLLPALRHAACDGAGELRTEKAALRALSRSLWPPCAACGKTHDSRRANLAVRKQVPIACTCGAALEVQAPPAAFAQLFPYARFVVDADVIEATAPAPAASADAKPVVMQCMACHAALPIDGTHRLVDCSYCQAQNYLPDDLWLSLHPAIKREAWFVVFDLDDALTAFGR